MQQQTVLYDMEVLHDAQVDIVPREERDDAAMLPRAPQPMSGNMPGTYLHPKMLYCEPISLLSAYFEGHLHDH